MIVGGGDDVHRGELERLAIERSASADGSRFERRPPRPARRRSTRTPTRCLSASLWEEPWGLVPLEAMAVGTPVIATGDRRLGRVPARRGELPPVRAARRPGRARRRGAAPRRRRPELRARLRAGGLATAAAFTPSAASTPRRGRAGRRRRAVAPVSGTPEIAVAVVSLNTRELLARCLDSLRRRRRGRSRRGLGGRQRLRDGSAELVRERFAWAELIEPRREPRLRAPRSTWSPSAPTSPGSRPRTPTSRSPRGRSRRCSSAGRAHPGAGALAPRLMLADGTTQHSVHAFPSLGAGARRSTSASRELVPGLGDRLCLEGRWDPERARARRLGPRRLPAPAPRGVRGGRGLRPAAVDVRRGPRPRLAARRSAGGRRATCPLRGSSHALTPPRPAMRSATSVEPSAQMAPPTDWMARRRGRATRPRLRARSTRAAARLAPRCALRAAGAARARRGTCGRATGARGALSAAAPRRAMRARRGSRARSSTGPVARRDERTDRRLRAASAAARQRRARATRALRRDRLVPHPGARPGAGHPRACSTSAAYVDRYGIPADLSRHAGARRRHLRGLLGVRARASRRRGDRARRRLDPASSTGRRGCARAADGAAARASSSPARRSAARSSGSGPRSTTPRRSRSAGSSTSSSAARS